MIKYFLTYLLFSFIVINAQDSLSIILTDDESVQIDSIGIVGNDKTEDFVILRELTFASGDSINSEILKYNEERILSLGLFTRVDINISQQGGKNIFMIVVEESWYFFPVPFIIIRERKFERTSYGLSLKYKNVRGRNETIRATIVVGYDPFFSLEYENPNLIYSHEITLFLAGVYGSPINKSPTLEMANGQEFDFRTYSFTSVFGKRLNRSSNINLSIGYQNLRAPNDNVNDFMVSGTRTDETISTGISYLLDSRNLKQYASRGNLLLLAYTHFGLGNSKINYNSIRFDARHYRQIYKSLLFKGQLTGRHTFGKYVPYYAYSMLGYNYYTRGNRYLVREGNNRVLGTVEVGYPILPVWNFGVKLPMLPKRLTRTRISVIASIFADAATTFNNNEKIMLNKFNFGYGGGITVIFLPYSSFRIQYAFNEMGIGEVILETEISF